jgi:hypothetical protein
MRFEKTCDACPEQYDVWQGKRRVGYVRLRWSWLDASCPDVNGEVVYQTQIGDSGYDGCFEDEEQRKYHLTLIELAIRKWMKKQKFYK